MPVHTHITNIYSRLIIRRSLLSYTHDAYTRLARTIKASEQDRKSPTCAAKKKSGMCSSSMGQAPPNSPGAILSPTGDPLSFSTQRERVLARTQGVRLRQWQHASRATRNRCTYVSYVPNVRPPPSLSAHNPLTWPTHNRPLNASTLIGTPVRPPSPKP